MLLVFAAAPEVLEHTASGVVATIDMPALFDRVGAGMIGVPSCALEGKGA